MSPRWSAKRPSSAAHRTGSGVRRDAPLHQDGHAAMLAAVAAFADEVAGLPRGPTAEPSNAEPGGPVSEAPDSLQPWTQTRFARPDRGAGGLDVPTFGGATDIGVWVAAGKALPVGLVDVGNGSRPRWSSSGAATSTATSTSARSPADCRPSRSTGSARPATCGARPPRCAATPPGRHHGGRRSLAPAPPAAPAPLSSMAPATAAAASTPTSATSGRPMRRGPSATHAPAL